MLLFHRRGVPTGDATSASETITVSFWSLCVLFMICVLAIEG
jgi:hypothetical protein